MVASVATVTPVDDVTNDVTNGAPVAAVSVASTSSAVPEASAMQMNFTLF